MKTYKARDLLEYSEDDMWAIDNGPIELIFDLGIVIQTTGRETIISSYGWDVHHCCRVTTSTVRGSLLTLT